jgi:hypothetical protein
MPRYYFHIHQQEKVIIDEVGLELTDLSAARAEAAQGALDLLPELLNSGERLNGLAIEIADEAGTTLELVPLTRFLDSAGSSRGHDHLGRKRLQ